MTLANEQKNTKETTIFETKNEPINNSPEWTTKNENSLEDLLRIIENAQKIIQKNNLLTQIVEVELERRKKIEEQQEIERVKTEKEKTSQKVTPIILPKTEKRNKHWKKIIGIGAIGAATTAITLSTILSGEKEKKEKEQEKNLNLTENTKTDTSQNKQDLTMPIDSSKLNSDSTKNKKSKIEPINLDLDKKLFIQEVYNSLPEQGKEVYKAFSEYDPTPGFGYLILDKDGATIFAIDKNNNLIAKIVCGFGKQLGDEKNENFAYNEGTMTTPSGIYLILNQQQGPPEDIEEYGKNVFPLYGITVKGDILLNLALHQVYSKHGELERRTKLLLSSDPSNKNFSNGCINVMPEEFNKILRKNYKGIGRELFIILQDKVGRNSPVKFNFKKLLDKMMPKIVEIANGLEDMNKKHYEDTYNTYKKIVDSLSVEIPKMIKNQGILVDIWKKNKSKEIEKKIASKNVEIKLSKKELFEARKFMHWGEKKLKDLYQLEQIRDQILAIK